MIGYGFLGGHKLESLARIPLAHEATIIARCQSARSVHGRAAEARQSQTLPRIPQPAPDDEAGWDEYMRRAFAGEIEPF